jgi:predicted amidohydrolase YtcJ
MNARWLLAACAVILAQGVSASELLLVHGHIYTANPRAPWAQALAITGSRIDAVGTDRQILQRRVGTSRVIDLRGRTVIPGIVDSHMHMLYGAFALHGLNLSTPESSITPEQGEALQARLRDYAATHREDSILFARADFSTVPPTTPTHELLDGAVSDRPLIVHNTSEHALWLNAMALRLARIGDEPVPDPLEERGVVRDASGHPRGVLLEAAMELAARFVNTSLDREVKLAYLREASRYLNRFGITSIVNATGDLAEIELYATLRERGELTVRTRTAFGAVAVPHHLTPQLLADLEWARTRYHDDWVAANVVKLFADGSTGLVPPLVYDPAAYREMVRELDRRGYQVMTHALRDDSVRMILDAYTQLIATNGPRDRRLRIEHADVVAAADIPRFASLGVIADMQPAFCCGADGTNYDPQSHEPTDRWRSLEQAGTVLAFSSDWPCTWPPDPFVAAQQATTRQIWHADATEGIAGGSLDGAGQGGATPTGEIYTPAERISTEAALGAYTRGSAFAAFSDQRVGTLEPGKEADLVLLSQDVFGVPHEQIAATRVRMTMLAGKVVYGELNER